jgi:hypothetical protein
MNNLASFNISEFYLDRIPEPRYGMKVSDILAIDSLAIFHTDISKFLFPLDIEKKYLEEIINNKDSLYNYSSLICKYLSVYGFFYKSGNKNINEVQGKLGSKISIARPNKANILNYYKKNNFYMILKNSTIIKKILENNFKINIFENIDAFTSIIIHSSYLDMDDVSKTCQKCFITLIDKYEKLFMLTANDPKQNKAANINAQLSKNKISQIKVLLSNLQKKTVDLKTTDLKTQDIKIYNDNKYLLYSNYKKMILWSSSILVLVSIVEIIGFQYYNQSFLDWGIGKLLSFSFDVPAQAARGVINSATKSAISIIGSIYGVFANFKNLVVSSDVLRKTSNSYPESQYEQTPNSSENIIMNLATNAIQSGFRNGSKIIQNINLGNQVALYVPSVQGIFNPETQSPYSLTEHIGTFVPSSLEYGTYLKTLAGLEKSQ